MPTILFAQFRKDTRARDHERACIETLLAGTCDVVWWDVIHEEHFPEHTDGIILGGSAELFLSRRNDVLDTEHVKLIGDVLSKTVPFVESALRKQMPIFGICFGHQLLGQLLGKRVVADTRGGKRGTHQVVLTEAGRSDPLFCGIADIPYVQYFHSDVLSELPDGGTLLASGARCPVSAFRYGDNVYGAQFHPELNEHTMRERALLCDDEDIFPLLKPSPHARQIMFNFVNLLL